MSPLTPTATETPGRFCSASAARTICRPCSPGRAHRALGRPEDRRHFLHVGMEGRRGETRVQKADEVVIRDSETTGGARRTTPNRTAAPNKTMPINDGTRQRDLP